MNREQLHALIYQALETEKGGVQVYETALRCVQNEELKEEWERYLEETRHHVEIVTKVIEDFGLDPETETPGRKIVRMKGISLVKAMEEALQSGEEAEAEIVAAECVVDAETKDHMNWDLIGETIKQLDGKEAESLKQAYDEVEDQEDEHLYHTMGWARELWIQHLGLPAVLPPPEERKHVESMAQAARVKQQRSRMVSRGGKRSRGPKKGARQRA